MLLGQRWVFLQNTAVAIVMKEALAIKDITWILGVEICIIPCFTMLNRGC